MNHENYCTLEAAKRLADVGISIDTEFYHVPLAGGRYSVTQPETAQEWEEAIPAPSMAEVWRELPAIYLYEGDKTRLYLSKNFKGDNFVEYAIDTYAVCESVHKNTSPTDALIDLLIWVRKETKDG